MSHSRTFVDTNVIVYAHDVTAREKRSRTREIIIDLWETDDGRLGCEILYSEDLNPGERYAGVTMNNPFTGLD